MTKKSCVLHLEARLLDELFDIVKCVRECVVRFAALIKVRRAPTTCAPRLVFLCAFLCACEVCATVDYVFLCFVCVAFSGLQGKTDDDKF